MPGATREATDICAGTVQVSLQQTVFVNGKPWAVLGTPITSHAPCPVPPSHCAAVMSGSSGTVYAEGILVCRLGDA